MLQQFDPRNRDILVNINGRLAHRDEAGVSPETSSIALEAYEDARIDGLRSALAILAALAIGALFFTGRIPQTQPGRAER